MNPNLVYPAHYHHVCPHCGRYFVHPVYLDTLGWHTACPSCEGSFDVELDPNDLGVKLRKAKAESKGGYSYNHGYLAGYADALAEVTGAKYYDISDGTGQGPVWEWLTETEAEDHRKAGYALTN